MIKNKKLIIIISIVILTIINVFLVFKKDTSEVEKNKVSKIERKEFSIYLQKTAGSETYDPSTDTAFPTSGYLLNTTKTMCYDYNGNKIDYKPTQELTKGSIDGRVTIESNNTIYCVLYFDLDNKVPEVNTFSITGKTSSGTELNNGYTYSLDVTYKGNWLDEDVVQYCISDNSQSCSNWTEISSKEVTVTSPNLTNGDGEKTMYIYLKDKANNVSVTTDKSTAKITVDRTAPVVNTFTLTGTADTNQELSSSTDYTHKVGITYNASIIETNISEYCVYEDSCNYTSLTSTSLTNQNYTLKDTEGSHSVKIKVKDKAGNESNVSTQSIKLDLNNPSVSKVTYKNKDTSSITVTVEGSDTTNGSGIVKYECSAKEKGVWFTQVGDTCTVTGLTDGTEYTIEGRVTDVSGRISTNNDKTVTQKTNKKITGSYLLQNPPAGLTATDCNGIKRFVGDCEAKNQGCSGIVDNFVCFGYSNEGECEEISITSPYLYRIIGILPDGSLKIVLNVKESYGLSDLAWSSSYRRETTWQETSIFKGINGDLFWNKLDVDWRKKVELSEWKNGNVRVSEDDGTTLRVNQFCEAERNLSGVEAYVGIISLNDAQWAYGNNGDESISHSYTSWILGALCGGRYNEEWSMTWEMYTYQGALRQGVYYITSTETNPEWTAGFRPVMVLSPEVEIVTGSGTLSDPFIIKL